MSWLSSAIHKVKKWQPGKTQWKDVGEATKTIVPLALGATGVGLPFAAAAGAGLSAMGAGKKTTLGTVLGGAAKGAAAGLGGSALSGAAKGFTAGDGILGALKGAGQGAVGGLKTGYESLPDMPMLGGGEGGGGGLDMLGGIAGLPGKIAGGASDMWGGLGSMEKAWLLSQVLSGATGTYGAYKEGKQEDEERARFYRERKASAQAFAPYLQRYLGG